MMHILVAPNAFKHSLDADEVAEAIILGLERSRLRCRMTRFPIGDGGDGTCKLIREKLNGQCVHHTVQDPLGRKIRASYSLIHDGHTAVVEMADASGIRLLGSHERDPMRASSVGTGELISHALDQGVKKIIIGMGGSATVDGACGMLHALGVRFLNAAGEVLSPHPLGLAKLEDIDLSGLDNRLSMCEITILCDVSNKLLGSEGAAAIFGPQKGATAQQVKQLDTFLIKLSELVGKKTGKAMESVISGGTAGGAAAGMFALVGAKLVNGIDFFLDITGFHQILDDADWIITGEGSLDDQTLGGKGPFGVAKLAKQKGIPVVGLAGKVPLKLRKQLSEIFDVVLPIGNEPTSLQEAFDDTVPNLQRTAEVIGNLIMATVMNRRNSKGR